MQADQGLQLKIKDLTRNVYRAQDLSPLSKSQSQLQNSHLKFELLSPQPGAKGTQRNPLQDDTNHQQPCQSLLTKTSSQFLPKVSPAKSRHNLNLHSSKKSPQVASNPESGSKTTDKQRKKHNFQFTRENPQKKNYINVYKSKDEKIKPEQTQQNTENNKEILKELAQNESIVQWVQRMVQFHKQKSEEKKFHDLLLQSIQQVLFPSPKVNSTLDSQLASVKHHLDSSAFIDLLTKSQAIKEIDELVMGLGSNLSAEKKLMGLSKVCRSLNIEGMPRLESESPVYKGQDASNQLNNVTVTEIMESQPQLQNDPISARVSQSSFGASPKRARRLINEPQQMQAKLQTQYSRFQSSLPLYYSYAHNYRSQSEGQKFIKQMEQSLASINNCAKVNDSSSSLHNTFNSQLSFSGPQGWKHKVVAIGTSPCKDEDRRGSPVKEKQNVGSKIMEEQMHQLRKEIASSQKDKENVRQQLEEAIEINQMLLNKVKRLEQSIREKTQQNL